MASEGSRQQSSGCCACGAGLRLAIAGRPRPNGRSRAASSSVSSCLTNKSETGPPRLPRLRKTDGPGVPRGGRTEQEVKKRRFKSKVLKRAETATKPESGERSPSRLRIVEDMVVEDRYIVGEAAGEGANGVVRIVTDKRTKQRRVLKTLRLSGSGSRSQIDNLLNEMEVYLRLDHPNVCRLLEVYAEEDAVHLIMELCTGRELFERWDGRGHYSESDTCNAVAQMLDALQYMHSHQTCHRDLKLENWVYADTSEEARLKLIDFGFSKVVAADTPMTGVLGTVFYIAPEVLRGSYDFKCDVWSTGIITYMLLTGVPPFGEFEDSDHDIMLKIKRGDAMKTNMATWKHVSQEGKDFVQRLLTRNPSNRPTAAEAAQHKWLERNASGIHVQASEINTQVLETMRAFASTNVIKRAACCLIAYSMSVDETDHLEAQFKKLDKEHNGTILMHEMVDALTEHLGMAKEEAEELFCKLDLTGDHQLNYSEFLAAACQRRFLAQENLIQEAFRRFDVDNTGEISLENLRHVLGDEYNGTRVEDILAQVDAKGNGVIEYEEFVRALMDLGTSAPDGRLEERQEGDLETVKHISRAFDFTSLGSLSPQNGKRTTSRSHLGKSRSSPLGEWDDEMCKVNSAPEVGPDLEVPKTRKSRSMTEFCVPYDEEACGEYLEDETRRASWRELSKDF